MIIQPKIARSIKQWHVQGILSVCCPDACRTGRARGRAGAGRGPGRTIGGGDIEQSEVCWVCHEEVKRAVKGQRAVKELGLP